MKDGWSKCKVSSDSVTIVNVVACSSMAVSGFANGRNIPVIFVEKGKENRVERILELHKSVKGGKCFSQLGFTDDKKYVTLLLKFLEPVEEVILLLFDIVKFGIAIEQLLKNECMYLMTGDEKSKISKSLSNKSILLEIPTYSFDKEWSKLYKKTYVRYIKNKYNLSKKDSMEAFEKLQKKADIIKKLRCKN